MLVTLIGEGVGVVTQSSEPLPPLPSSWSLGSGISLTSSENAVPISDQELWGTLMCVRRPVRVKTYKMKTKKEIEL